MSVPSFTDKGHLHLLWEQSLRISEDLAEAVTFFESLLPRGSSASIDSRWVEDGDGTATTEEWLDVQIPKRSIVDRLARDWCSLCNGEGVVAYDGHVVPCVSEGCPGPERPETRVRARLPVDTSLLYTQPNSRQTVLDHEQINQYGRFAPKPDPVPPPKVVGSSTPLREPNLLDMEFDFS